MAFPLSGQAILRTWHGQPGDGFGAAVAALGDTDLDGSVDFAVGAPDRNAGFGAVDVFSCGSGALLRSLAGTVAGDRFGIDVQPAGDLDRDGFRDLWVRSVSSLYGYSGRDGSLLWRYAPQFFAPMSDYDADGHDDLALVDAVGDVLVHSGRNGAVLGRLPATTWPVVRFAVCGDVDGDGSPDVMTTRLESAAGLRHVDVFSVRSGQSLFHSAGFASTRFGEQIGAAGDVDGDGRADFFVHEPEWETWNEYGITRVYSGATLAELLRDTGVNWCDHGSCTRVLRQQGYAGPPADVDGDGRAERLVVQQLWASTQVAVRNGNTTVLRLPGSQVLGAGDADRDGAGDFLVTPAAEVRLVSAARTARQHHGVAVVTERSYGCEACADADVDGYADYWVSRAVPPSTPWTIVVTLYSGRDGSALRSYTRDSWSGAYRLVLATGGDIDHDGSPDIAVTGNAPGQGDEIRVYGNLRASTPALVVAINGTNTALATGADWTGDGTTDVFSATSSVVEVRSGATGGLVLGLPFGAADLRLIGDVDGDAVADLLADDWIVGSRNRALVRNVTLPVAFVHDANSDRLADAWIVDRGELVLVSGFHGRELRRLPAPGADAIASLAAASDWNRDGWLDVVVGQPDWDGVGRAAVVSGLDGSVLHTEWGEAIGDAFGTRVGALAFDGARYTEPALVATAVHGDLMNSGYGRWAQARMHPAAVNVHGIACGSAGVRPELLWSGGAPRLGGTFLLETAGLRSGAPTMFLAGMSEDAYGTLALPASLHGIGMPGCVLHVAIDVQVPAVAGGAGRASMSMVIPHEPALLGSRLFSQALVVELAANSAGLLTSDAARVVIGR